MKKIYFIALCMLFILSNCSSGGDDDSTSMSTLTGWYADLDGFVSEDDFEEINEAIRNEEVLYKTKNETYIATREFFFHDKEGIWMESGHEYGRFRWYLTKDRRKDTQPTIIQILNKNTLIEYGCNLCDPKFPQWTSGSKDIVRIYAGPIFKELVYRGGSYTYTYTRVDNKIIVSNGDIYTITNEGLVKDGGWIVIKKFDPNKTY